MKCKQSDMKLSKICLWTELCLRKILVPFQMNLQNLLFSWQFNSYSYFKAIQLNLGRITLDWNSKVICAITKKELWRLKCIRQRGIATYSGKIPYIFRMLGGSRYRVKRKIQHSDIFRMYILHYPVYIEQNSKIYLNGRFNRVSNSHWIHVDI
jgi:hypothetical protein